MSISGITKAPTKTATKAATNKQNTSRDSRKITNCQIVIRINPKNNFPKSSAVFSLSPVLNPSPGMPAEIPSDNCLSGTTPLQFIMAEPTAANGSQGHAFENALQAWTEIDLSSLQGKLDEQGMELKNQQKQSLASRKDLASKTKDFKKLDDSVKLTEFKLLLKMYQNEIDSLTTKQKKAESFFFGFYRLIAEAPDPKPLLEHSLDAVIELTEVAGLKLEVSKLKEDLAKKADYEILKQRLLRNEQKSAELLAAKLKAQEDEFRALIDEKESNWQSIQKQHDSQIAAYKNTVEELKTSKEVTELQLNSQNRQLGGLGASSASAIAELDMVTRDLETWKKRVFELERRNEDLRRELSISKNDSDKELVKEEFSKKVAELEGENVLLIANLNQVKERLEANAKDHENKAQSLNRELAQNGQEIKNLKERLEKTSDYDELKHELTLIRQIEFGEGGAEDKDIDELLIERNKALNKELAEFRSQHDGFASQISELQSQLQSAHLELTRIQELNLRLESDLANVQEASGVVFNDTASLVSGMTRMTRQTGRGSVSGPLSGVDESSILPIITKQRDRFREKNKELEDDLRKQYTLVADLKRKNKTLQTDNEDLYEKTRYMALIKKNEQAERLSAGPRKLLTPKTNVVDLENPYRASYESKLHPIEEFRRREQERVSSRLSPFERLFIFVTRSILATRLTRMLFLAYCVFLHFIVIFTTIHSINLSTNMIPEVGLNQSTGGVADNTAKGSIVQEPSI